MQLLMFVRLLSFGIKRSVRLHYTTAENDAMLAQAQGVFQFFNKPGQKGQGQGSRRTPQATTAQEAKAVNADWGDQQVCSASFKHIKFSSGFFLKATIYNTGCMALLLTNKHPLASTALTSA